MNSLPAERCGVCGRLRGDGIACQFCGHVEGLPGPVRLASVGARLGAFVLDAFLPVVVGVVGLMIHWVFLGLGILAYLLWALIAYGRAQTPGKQLLGMRVVILETGHPAGWGRMFVREVIAKWLIGAFLGWLAFPYFWLLWDRNRQQLWDKITGTVVVDNARHRYEQPYTPPASRRAILPPSNYPPQETTRASDHETHGLP